MKTDIVLIQPTPFCNINCRYCYLPYRSLGKHIDFATLEQIFKVLFFSPFIEEKVACLWHAGEPLVLPIDFYRRAFEIQQKWNVNGVKIINAFQTNATLISQEWCDFILEQRIKIGVSIDGPAYLHNAQRVDRKNRGTFDRVMRGIELLRKNAIPYSIIAVVTSETVQHPDEFWHFFAELRPTRLSLNPEEVKGSHASSSLHTPAGIEQFKLFLQRLLVLNKQNQFALSIREFDVLLKRIQEDSAQTQSDTSTPMAILNFDYEGNISTFSPELLSFTHPTEGRFTFGNVFDNTLEDVLTHIKFVAVNEAIQRGISKCRETCEYFALCRGGVPATKLNENGTFASAETNACRLRIKVTADILLDYLEERYHISSSS